MNSIELALSPLSEADHRAQLRRAVIASTVGTAIEWYDFLLYGQMTALVFGKLFFPKSDPLVSMQEIRWRWNTSDRSDPCQISPVERTLLLRR